MHCNGDNDDIDDNDNYEVVQTGLFGQQAGRQVYKCTDVLVLVLVYTLVAGAKAGILSLLLFHLFLPVHPLRSSLLLYNCYRVTQGAMLRLCLILPLFTLASDCPADSSAPKCVAFNVHCG